MQYQIGCFFHHGRTSIAQRKSKRKQVCDHYFIADLISIVLVTNSDRHVGAFFRFCLASNSRTSNLVGFFMKGSMKKQREADLNKFKELMNNTK